MKIKMIKLGWDIDETRNRRICGIIPTIDKKFLFIELSLIHRPDIKHTSLSNAEYEKKYPNKEYISIDSCFRVDLPEDFYKNNSKEFREYFYKDFFEFEYTNSNIVKVLQIFNPNIEDIELTTDYYIDKFCEEKGFFKLYDKRLNHSYEPLKINWIGLPNKNTAIVKLLYTCYASNGTEYKEELRERHSIQDLIKEYGKEKIQKLINEDIEQTCAIHSTPEAKENFKKYREELFEKYCQEIASTITNEIEDIKENYDYDY